MMMTSNVPMPIYMALLSLLGMNCRNRSYPVPAGANGAPRPGAEALGGSRLHRPGLGSQVGDQGVGRLRKLDRGHVARSGYLD